jgi:hypothetical protein
MIIDSKIEAGDSLPVPSQHLTPAARSGAHREKGTSPGGISLEDNFARRLDHSFLPEKPSFLTRLPLSELKGGVLQPMKEVYKEMRDG